MIMIADDVPLQHTEYSFKSDTEKSSSWIMTECTDGPRRFLFHFKMIIKLVATFVISSPPSAFPPTAVKVKFLQDREKKEQEGVDEGSAASKSHQEAPF